MNKIQQAIELGGGSKVVAQKLGLSYQMVQLWKIGKRKPTPTHGAQIELLTGGVVTRRDMFPDCWHEVWPELVGQQNMGGQ
jgi:DNA-binding transcriptional regulator YdaS (Cro superfamily)